MALGLLTPAMLGAQTARLDPEPRCESPLVGLPSDPAVRRALRETLDGHRGVVVRWAKRPDETIRVWVQPSSSPSGSLEHPAARMQAVHSAMARWTRAVGIQLRATDDSAAAEVHIVWQRSRLPTATNASPPAARTTLQGIRAAGRITGALIQIREASNTGALFRADEIHAIALHEVGHVLGLKHRSEDGTFMTAAMRAGTLSARDIAVARAWYGLPVGSGCEALPSA